MWYNFNSPIILLNLVENLSFLSYNHLTLNVAQVLSIGRTVVEILDHKILEDVQTIRPKRMRIIYIMFWALFKGKQLLAHHGTYPVHHTVYYSKCNAINLFSWCL